MHNAKYTTVYVRKSASEPCRGANGRALDRYAADRDSILTRVLYRPFCLSSHSLPVLSQIKAKSPQKKSQKKRNSASAHSPPPPLPLGRLLRESTACAVHVRCIALLSQVCGLTSFGASVRAMCVLCKSLFCVKGYCYQNAKCIRDLTSLCVHACTCQRIHNS